MKFRKTLSGILALSIAIPSFSLKSMAYEEIPNRYQTLEGERITIDDSTEGELHEIEIFGNTVQDENNLENIQSVGDLHVDEDGNPILDKQGGEQYKINIISHSYHSSYEKFNFKETKINSINTTPWESRYFDNHVVPITSENDSFDLIIIRKDNNNTLLGQSFFRIFATVVDDEGNIIKELGNYTMKKNKEEMLFEKSLGNLSEFVGYNLIISFRDISGTSDSVSGNELFDNFDIGLINSAKNEVFPLIGTINKVEILLPCQLQKVGKVSDRLYWDRENNRYIIEKRIASFTLSKHGEGFWSGGKIAPHQDIDSYTGFDIFTGKKILQSSSWLSTERSLKPKGTYLNGVLVALYPNNEDGSKKTYTEIVECIERLEPKIYVVLEDSIKIETTITSKLVIPTYEDRTHIYAETENGINPTLKVTVDKLNRMAQDTVVEVEEEPTISKLSLARNIVNQMDESLLKDQLQERLNNLFSLDDMQLERKTASSNIDVYIKCDNMLSLSLSTNSITFENFGGTEDLEKVNAVELTINSSLPYEVNAYLPQEIQNNDKTVVLDKDILNIKANSEIDYNKFADIDTKLQLLDNQPANNNVIHGIDIMLKGGIAHKKDAYKGTIKFEVVQK